ncbi:MAG: LptF/LptG family permease [Elusimicrobia bacterium]|nr:LptF/LptG family permease [Elusimicrobiota bacterium]
MNLRIFTWYMVRRFFKPFFFGLGIFAVLIFLGDMFNKMHLLMKSSASLLVIMEYLWLEVPYWTVRTIPMATLLATLVAITGFMQSGEWLAVQSCGFQTKTFWRPLLGCAMGVTLLSFAAQETILPAAFQRAGRLWQERIHPEWEWDLFSDIALVAGPDHFISAREFKPSAGRLTRPLLDDFGPDGVAFQLDAKLALWDAAAKRWIFYDGVSRSFDQGRLRELPFRSKVSDFDVPPRSLIPRTTNPDEMSLRELLRYCKRRRLMGDSVTALKVAAHAKLAYPFVNLVICALGIPIALRLRRSPRVASFCVALALSFLYLWVIELGRALGAGGRLPPLAAAWSPNVVFAALAAVLLKKWEV